MAPPRAHFGSENESLKGLMCFCTFLGKKIFLRQITFQLPSTYVFTAGKDMNDSTLIMETIKLSFILDRNCRNTHNSDRISRGGGNWMFAT